MTTDYKVTELFCIIDEFCKHFEAENAGNLLEDYTPDTTRHKGFAVVMGNEVKGVHQEVVDMSDRCLEIPQFGTKHSLNVSVTAGIVIWEFAKSLML